MFDSALPFWAAEGVDKRHGGFVEALDFEGRDAGAAFKRTRVAFRQIYVFSHACTLGWTDGADLVADGVSFLMDRAWNGPDHGFVRQLTQEGAVLDATPDLYDHAFALFGFAWAYRATQESRYKELAAQTLDAIEWRLRHPSGRGYMHENPMSGYRLQNPHMHLLEASLAAHQATGDDRYETVALEIIDLFKSHFFNRETGTLAEYFNDGLSRAAGQDGRLCEPGHQLEWAWILECCQRQFGIDAQDEILRLIGFSERWGVNDLQCVMNTTRDDGAPIDAGSRAWPNTERLKAAVAAERLGRPNMKDAASAAVDVLLDRYLSPCEGFNIPKGGWIDQFDAAGAPTAKNMPASTFYHVFLAFAEGLSVTPASTRK